MLGSKKKPGPQVPPVDARIMEDQEWQQFYDQLVQAADDALRARRSVLLTISAQAGCPPEYAEAATRQLEQACQKDLVAEQYYENLKTTHGNMLALFQQGQLARASGNVIFTLP